MNNYQDLLKNVKPFSHYVTGEAAFLALKLAVDELTNLAPQDHDILIEAFGLIVKEVKYIEPHTFLFSGVDDKENNSFVICHYSQLLVRVIHLPKKEEVRCIIGFLREKES